MINFSTTKMTSKGQVVIPEETRKRLGMKPGTQFMVVESADALIFKVIQPPSMEDFDKLLAETRRQARKAGLKKSDITQAVKSVRAETKKR
ncbi:MAG: AbrB/MazE/SpoVT family DNA-binding domain-containing protein [Candidatus Omnitrophica bacterium]|nr:AbrB/MazE/SpoVT family DNA-binding domain-containing protein [Candidatus Omnitrophota bacterium]MBI5024480.1 AbrB/MazE/SpoVT family DNA-binding domain-containing protein [Candidatus Omnitrophota bacterium]